MSEFKNMNQKIDTDIHQLLREQLTIFSNYNNEENNSFAYLEKGTLNLLITYLISGEKRKAEDIGDMEIEIKIIEQLDEILEKGKEQFEEVLSLIEKFS